MAAPVIRARKAGPGKSERKASRDAENALQQVFPDNPGGLFHGQPYSTARRFPDLFTKSLHIAFDDPTNSSGGGSVLLSAGDKRLGFNKAMAACLRDGRRRGSVLHSYGAVLSERVYGMAIDHEDANEAPRLDAAAALTGDGAGEDLASGPSLSRFENAAKVGSLYGMGMAFQRFRTLRIVKYPAFPLAAR